MHSHCYLHRPHLVPFGHRIPIAPQYLLKLKSAAAIALVSIERTFACNKYLRMLVMEAPAHVAL